MIDRSYNTVREINSTTSNSSNNDLMPRNEYNENNNDIEYHSTNKVNNYNNIRYIFEKQY